MTELLKDEKLDPDVVRCPYCKEFIIIEQLNCAIFRHAQKKDGQHLNPHASLQECESWGDEVVGCRKPFRVIVENGFFRAEACDYI